jgi:hypothetical protein
MENNNCQKNDNREVSRTITPRVFTDEETATIEVVTKAIRNTSPHINMKLAVFNEAELQAIAMAAIKAYDNRNIS